MENIACTPESKNLYIFDYRTEVTDALGKAMGFDFTKKRLSRSEEKYLGDAKNRSKHYN